MICSTCGHENRKAAKFCTGCGASLVPACPKCGAAAEVGERFCAECGTALASPSPSAVPTSAERKQITVLFADVAGSMDLQEQMDAEVWAGIMGRFVSILAEGVRKYGGTVDKFTGDGIMALFGAPVAQEDHARRACHAAWHLTKAIAEYAQELRRDQGVELHVRLGLNSGEVVVGRVGDEVELDPTALGHTVGLAQRMEAMAEPGEANLTEHTARLVEGWFTLEALGPVSVKGARDPVRVHVLRGPAPSGADGGGRTPKEAPLVGRRREMTRLEEALATAEEGRAQVVGVVGEAGVGKSRLCDEFVRAAAERGISVRRTAGVSHGRDIPLLPVLALLRQYFDITEADSQPAAREKVSDHLLGLDPRFEDALPLVFDVLEVPDPDRPAPHLAADARRRRVFEILRQITQRRSERETLILVIEDLHWFDEQSDAFLAELIPSFPGTRTLVLANFRPEYQAAWMRHSYYQQLSVAPLSPGSTETLVRMHLGDDVSLEPLAGLIVGHTAGNPFFVEEVVRSLAEDGTLAGEAGAYTLTRPVHHLASVPPTVQATLAARIDRLDERHKALLQTAAVIGRTFPAPVLGAVAGVSDDDLAGGLRGLCEAEFLQEDGPWPRPEYRFWHPLTQQVAYSTLLSDERARRHSAVARAMIDLDVDRHDERAALIALHFERAGDRVEAARWHGRAAVHSVRSDLDEAMRRWRASLALLDGVPETDDVLSLGVTVRTRLAQYGARIDPGMAELEPLVHEGRALAESLGDVGLLASLIQAHGSVKLVSGQLLAATACIEKAAGFADRITDLSRRVSLLMDPPIVYSYVGPVPDALRLTERVIAECAGRHDLGVAYWGYSSLHSVMRTRADVLALSGRLQEALPQAEQVLVLAREHAEVEMQAWVLATYPRLVHLTGEDHDLIAAVEDAVRISEETGNHVFQIMSLEALGVAHLVAGHSDRAVATLSRSIDDGRAKGIHMEEARSLAYLAEAYMTSGDPGRARRAAAHAVALARSQGARVIECFALLARARAERSAGADPNGVLADLNAATVLVRATGSLIYEPFIREELGRLQQDGKQLSEALQLYQQVGATGHARRIEAELSRLPR